MTAEPLAHLPFAVLIATRNRPEVLEGTLAALSAQSLGGFDVVVVDQSDALDPMLSRRIDEDAQLTVIRDTGRGLSRARNLGWPRVTADWVVFLDDDCRPEAEWAGALQRALAAHPEASVVSGEVLAGNAPTHASHEHIPVTVSHIPEPRVLSGRWTRPWDIGFTVCMAARRSVVAQLGGFDERLGAGVAEFPSAEDMDFNYRLLRAGEVAYVTPDVRAHHDQWRGPDELGSHFRGYMTGWSGFAMKHLRSGDVLGGLWLWSYGVRDTARMFASALRRRSWLRLQVAWMKLLGLGVGTARGCARSW